MKWNNDTKEIVSYATSTLLLIFGCALLLWGFITPPQGEIHGSLQLIFGQILVYSGATFGLALHFDNKSKTMEARIDKKIKDFEDNKKSDC